MFKCVNCLYYYNIQILEKVIAKKKEKKMNGTFLWFRHCITADDNKVGCSEISRKGSRPDSYQFFFEKASNRQVI